MEVNTKVTVNVDEPDVIQELVFAQIAERFFKKDFKDNKTLRELFEAMSLALLLKGMPPRLVSMVEKTCSHIYTYGMLDGVEFITAEREKQDASDKG